MPAISIAAVVTFLSNTSLAIFAFLIMDIKVVSISLSGWLYVSIFLFLLIKIIIQGSSYRYIKPVVYICERFLIIKILI